MRGGAGFIRKIKKAPSDGASAQIASSFGSSLELKYRRIWHLTFPQVAGFHRADPSTTLDKVYIQLTLLVYPILRVVSMVECRKND
jgi:hypothetical protein